MSERSGWQANKEKKPLEWSRDERSWNKLGNGAVGISRRAANATGQSSRTENSRELDSLLTQELGQYASEDTSLVVFGSLARGEWTSGSDLDWTYLIDGQANSDHPRIAQKINRLVRERFTGPGATGTFGNLAFSHELIHQIGGQTIRTRTQLSESCCHWNRRSLATEPKPMIG